jgi:hypothetical protein
MAKQTSGQTSLKRDIHEVLAELGPLLVGELFRKTGYREENTDEIEVFYRLLDEALKSKRIAIEVGDDPERSRLKVVRA